MILKEKMTMARRGGRRNKGREVIGYTPREAKEEKAVEEQPRQLLSEPVVVEPKVEEVREVLTEPAPADAAEEKKIAAEVQEESKPSKKKRRKKTTKKEEEDERQD